jgi:hypothetical protein
MTKKGGRSCLTPWALELSIAEIQFWQWNLRQVSAAMSHCSHIQWKDNNNSDFMASEDWTSNVHKVLVTRNPDHNTCYHFCHCAYYHNIWEGRGKGEILFYFLRLQTFLEHTNMCSTFINIPFSSNKERLVDVLLCPFSHPIWFIDKVLVI